MAVEFERGYLILATNTEQTDYLACARALAKSLRYWMPDCKICLVTNDPETDPVFDLIKPLPFGDQGGWHNDWQVFAASPFRETIKLEADMVITQSIAHWWSWFEHRDVVISRGMRNYLNDISKCRAYRRMFDENDLPDVYNAITYWRLSRTAAEFFNLVRDIFEQWTDIRRGLKYCDNVPANTDMVYAIVATILGVENVTLPDAWPNIIHMKPAVNFLNNEQRPWTDEFVWELHNGGIRVNTIEQQWPWHYHEKVLAPRLEDYYGQLLASRTST